MVGGSKITMLSNKEKKELIDLYKQRICRRNKRKNRLKLFLEENVNQTMLSIEERETIEYIKSRLYGNELRIFLNLVEKK